MSETIPLTIITGLFSLPYATLLPQLWQLTHQTVRALEILVISSSPDRDYRDGLRAECERFEGVQVIDAPQAGLNYNASHAANVGIRLSNPVSKFITCLSAGLLFNETSLEALYEALDPDCIHEAPMANLPGDYDYGPIETLWQRWGDFSTHLDVPNVSFSPGALSCVTREWLFKVHGYDEVDYPMAYNDSDLLQRAAVSGLKVKAIPWGKLQIIHITHPIRYALTTAPRGNNLSTVRNGDKWGEL